MTTLSDQICGYKITKNKLELTGFYSLTNYTRTQRDV